MSTQESRAYYRTYKRGYVAARKQEGGCVECKSPSLPNRIRCEDCISRRNQQRRDRIAVCVIARRCSSCFQAAALEGHRCCACCYFKNVATRHFGSRKRWQELLLLWERQAGRCAYTGLPLTLGENADLDHLLPRSAGGGDEPANLQWVLDRVNRLKRDLCEPDFLFLVKAIATHRCL